MNKIKVAKELVKLAKSLIANDIDEQTKVRLEEAEKSGKKYILHHKEGNLWRIMACKDWECGSDGFKVKKGDFGGLIQRESNLSHNDSCWIGDDSKVYGKACVCEDAHVLGKSQIYGSAKIYEYGVISDSKICDNAKVFGGARVDNSDVYEKAQIYGNAMVQGSSAIHGKAQIFGEAGVFECDIFGNAQIDYFVEYMEIAN